MFFVDTITKHVVSFPPHTCRIVVVRIPTMSIERRRQADSLVRQAISFAVGGIDAADLLDPCVCFCILVLALYHLDCLDVFLYRALLARSRAPCVKDLTIDYLYGRRRIEILQSACFRLGAKLADGFAMP